MANNKIGNLEDLLPSYWGEADHWDEARTMAAIAQAHATETISNTLLVLAGEVLERLDDINRALLGITKAILTPDELEIVESYDGGLRVIDFDKPYAGATPEPEETDDPND
jgi:hypothetical protein